MSELTERTSSRAPKEWPSVAEAWRGLSARQRVLTTTFGFTAFLGILVGTELGTRPDNPKPTCVPMQVGPASTIDNWEAARKINEKTGYASGANDALTRLAAGLHDTSEPVQVCVTNNGGLVFNAIDELAGVQVGFEVTYTEAPTEATSSDETEA